MNNTIDTRPIMVAIKCLTYNHEPYIRQCLEGFVMQKTNFRFVAIVHDDASTDGTAAIIREYAEKYPDMIRPIYETENQYSKHDDSLIRIMNKAIDATGCKYVALCEGDDYWIDPLKLQKQVDYLELHDDTGLVYTDFDYCSEDLNLINNKAYATQIGIKNRFENGYVFHSYLSGKFFIQTCTICFRRSLYVEDQAKGLDTSLFMTISRQSKVYLINEKTACYRLHENGAMMTIGQQLIKRTYQIKYDQFYYFHYDKERTEKFYLESKESRRILSKFYMYAWLFLIVRKVRGSRKIIYITLHKPRYILTLPKYFWDFLLERYFHKNLKIKE